MKHEKCRDCRKPHIEESGWNFLYNDFNGYPVWVCDRCKAKRDADDKARAEANRVSVETWAARDEWEEG